MVWVPLKIVKTVIPLLGTYPKNMNQHTTKAPAHPYLLQHYTQQLSYKNTQDAPLLMNMLRKRGINIQ
jgi:hypothetical protein